MVAAILMSQPLKATPQPKQAHLVCVNVAEAQWFRCLPLNQGIMCSSPTGKYTSLYYKFESLPEIHTFCVLSCRDQNIPVLYKEDIELL
jgi:hypothetical protein